MFKTHTLTVVAVLALSASTATAGGGWGGGHNWGGEDGSVGGTLDSKFSVNNLAGAAGDLGIAETSNFKSELGGVEVVQNTDGPDSAVAFGSVLLGGSGHAAAISVGSGTVTAETFTGGAMNIDMTASTFED